MLVSFPLLASSFAANTCTGTSANVTQVQCDAWGDFYDATGGDSWAVYGTRICEGAREDPCSCHGYNGGFPVCHPDGTAIQQMYAPLAPLETVPLARRRPAPLCPPDHSPTHPPTTASSAFFGSNLVGTVPASASAFVNLTNFYVPGNKLGGAFPLGASAWAKLARFDVHSNLFQGPLPALPFASMRQTQVSGCYLMDHPDGGTNAFSCPWPVGATDLCQKFSSFTGGWVALTDADCK